MNREARCGSKCLGRDRDGDGDLLFLEADGARLFKVQMGFNGASTRPLVQP